MYCIQNDYFDEIHACKLHWGHLEILGSVEFFISNTSVSVANLHYYTKNQFLL